MHGFGEVYSSAGIIFQVSFHLHARLMKLSNKEFEGK
jgi:hypothetical protein